MNNSTRYAFGLDTSDREIHAALFEPGAKLIDESSMPLFADHLRAFFGEFVQLDPVIALETGTHANWLYDLFKQLGFSTVLVADARQLKLISQSKKKTDQVDARMLGRIAQSCPELLHPVTPRGEQARQDRRLLAARHIAVQARTKIITHVRGIVKSTGARLADCASSRFADFDASLPPSLQAILSPLLELIHKATETIETYNVKIDERCKGDPVIERLTQVPQVGSITALAYSATVEDPSRFPRNRDVASYLGITPRVDDSGDIKKQLHISKAGDGYVRHLLVSSAQGLMRRSAPATDLKRWGLSIAETGAKRGKRRAAVAVARKLAVLLLTLWKTGADYEPLRNQKAAAEPRKSSAKQKAVKPLRKAA